MFSHCTSWLLSGTTEEHHETAVEATNSMCFRHPKCGKNCTITCPARQSKSSNVKLAVPPWREGAGAAACSWRHTVERKGSSVVPTLFLKTSLSKEWSPSPSSKDLWFGVFFPNYTKAAFSFFNIPSTCANIPLYCLYSAALGHGYLSMKKKT